MKTMEIGGVKLKSRAVMAPIAGMTDRPFRALVMEFGAGMVTTELLSANALVRDSKKTVKMLPQPGEPRPVAAQIFGGDSDTLKEAAIIVAETDCDFIDLNFGCPIKKVTKLGGGAAILTDIKKAERIATAVTSSVDKPVTVKIRSGWDLNNINAVELAKVLEGAGIAALALHARSASQGYSGEADWDLIAKVAKAAQIPVIGNGDIHSPEQAVARLKSSGCAFVMIGRGALGAPWIFRQFNDFQSTGNYGKMTADQMAPVILRHFEMIISFYGERIAVRKMRTWLGYYAKGIPGGARFREEVNRTTAAENLKELITHFFTPANETVFN